MKPACITTLALLGMAATSALGATECETLAREVTEQISAEPNKILVVVDAAISQNEGCACEVVSAAIKLVPGDEDMVREIVIAAVSAAPSAAPRIAECAIATEPSAASQIAAGLDEVFEGAKAGMDAKQPVSSKDAKEVVIEEDFGPSPVVVSGVYLIAPGGASAVGEPETIEIWRTRYKREKPWDKTTPPQQTTTNP